MDCEFCGHHLTDETKATAFGLTVCGDFDACLERQAANGDRDAAEILADRKRRKEAQDNGQSISNLQSV